MELNFLILKFLVFCAMMEVVNMTFPIKQVHVELNFSKIEFCTIFFFKMELDLYNIKFFGKL